MGVWLLYLVKSWQDAYFGRVVVVGLKAERQTGELADLLAGTG